MIRLGRNQYRDSGGEEAVESEGYWASYSDLMAALLMVFALTTMAAILDIHYRTSEPARVVEEWESVVKKVSAYEGFATMKGVTIDPETGALIISNDSLRFRFNSVAVSDEGKELLRKVVPDYMALLSQYPEILARISTIEVSGHTDKEDQNGGNPYLSRERAGQVLAFLMGEPEMQPFAEIWNQKAVAAGYSDTKFPVHCPQDRCGAARRVEIRILLNEREMLRDFLNALKGVTR